MTELTDEDVGVWNLVQRRFPYGNPLLEVSFLGDQADLVMMSMCLTAWFDISPNNPRKSRYGGQYAKVWQMVCGYHRTNMCEFGEV